MKLAFLAQHNVFEICPQRHRVVGLKVKKNVTGQTDTVGS